MNEGRRSQVVLLDERRLDLFIQPKLFAGELLDIVASHFHLKEKEYFGIAYLNEAGQYSWLQLDKRVLEHEFPKKCSSNAPALTFYFRVKYFVESLSHLKDSATVEAFYLQAKSLLSKGELEADNETVFQLAAFVLQATYGDFNDDGVFRSHLRKLPVLPATTLKDFSSIVNCEEKVLTHYKGLIGQSRGDAIVNYLSIIESLPTYGQHNYEVKDKTGAQCHLGLNYRGISQYDKNDKRNPSRVFLWKQLENLYFRDKKFTIEVHEARRVVHTLSSFNLYEDAIEEPVEEYDDLSNAICDPTTQVSVSRRTLAPANVTVYVWYASSPIVTKCIWSMAIAQHHFFLDRQHQKSHVKLAPCLSQIASELCRSTQSLSSIGSQTNISRSTSTSSLPSTILGAELSEESKAATIEMLSALQSRKDALDEALKKKTEELKALCVKEGELTGEIPPEIPLQPGEPCPQVRRRVGTSFCLSEKWVNQVRSKERETLNDLELEREIQSKIASAAYQLANDCTARKSVRKQRKILYAQTTAKLRSLELRLNAFQKENNPDKEDDDKENHGSEGSVSSGEKRTLVGSRATDSISSHSESGTLMSSAHSVSSIPPCGSLPQLTVTPTSDSPTGCRQRHQSLQHMPFPADRWTTSMTYRHPVIEFDTVSCNSSNSGAAAAGVTLRSPYRNRFEAKLDIEGSNLYSVPNRRASQVFDSQDDLILGGRKNDYEKRSPSTTITLNHQYNSSMPLSASYDERMWSAKSKELAAISSECSSLETSFDNHSNSSYDNYFHGKQAPVVLRRNSPKLHHFYSENSLHREEFSDNPHLSVQSIRQPVRQMMHVHSVPHLHEEISVHKQLPKSNHSVSNVSHSLNQVVDLVNASMLRQGGKMSTSLQSQTCLSPKTKTKEWIETSLDSPPPVRKSKSRTLCDSNVTIRSSVPENIYDNQVISLSPYTQDHYCDEVFNTTTKEYIKPIPVRTVPQYSNVNNDQFVPIETPTERLTDFEKPVYDLRCNSNDDSAHLYANLPCNDSQNIACSQVPTFSSARQNFAADLRIDTEIHLSEPYTDFAYQPPPPPVSAFPTMNDTVDGPVPYTTMSTTPAGPQVPSTPHNISVCSSNNDSTLDNTVIFNEATIVDIPQEVLDPFPPYNNSGTEGTFPFPSNIEVNVVSVGQFQPYWEETKPYELSDFYKYSTKHRKSFTPSETTAEKTDQCVPSNDHSWMQNPSSVLRNNEETLVKQIITPPHNDILMNTHIAVVGHADYSNLDYSSLFQNEGKQRILTSPSAGDLNGSFGEMGIRVSVADTFHDEMLAWYENRDSVKKATLV